MWCVSACVCVQCDAWVWCVTHACLCAGYYIHLVVSSYIYWLLLYYNMQCFYSKCINTATNRRIWRIFYWAFIYPRLSIRSLIIQRINHFFYLFLAMETKYLPYNTIITLLWGGYKSSNATLNPIPFSCKWIFVFPLDSSNMSSAPILDLHVGQDGCLSNLNNDNISTNTR